MGAVKKPLKKLESAAKKQVRKVGYAVQGSKEKARGTPPPAAQTAAPSTAAAREQTEEVATTVETGAGIQRRRRRGKKALIAGQGSAQVAGGESGSGLNIPKA
jgi:hypothetical protein